MFGALLISVGLGMFAFLILEQDASRMARDQSSSSVAKIATIYAITLAGGYALFSSELGMKVAGEDLNRASVISWINVGTTLACWLHSYVGGASMARWQPAPRNAAVPVQDHGILRDDPEISVLRHPEGLNRRGYLHVGPFHNSFLANVDMPKVVNCPCTHGGERDRKSEKRRQRRLGSKMRNFVAGHTKLFPKGSDRQIRTSGGSPVPSVAYRSMAENVPELRSPSLRRESPRTRPSRQWQEFNNGTLLAIVLFSMGNIVSEMAKRN